MSAFIGVTPRKRAEKRTMLSCWAAPAQVRRPKNLKESAQDVSSRTRNHLLAAYFTGLCLLGAAFTATAQAKPESAAASPGLPPAQTPEIAAALQNLPKQRGLDADTRKQAEDLLHQA